MKKLAMIFGAIGLVFSLGACGDEAYVPPAHVGKLLGSSGYQKGTIPPSSIRLSNWCVSCDQLILLETSDQPITIDSTIFMPKDQLNLRVFVRGTVQINDDDAKSLEDIYDRVPASSLPGEKYKRTRRIDLEDVYKIYGAPVVNSTIRNVITQYDIRGVMANRQKVEQELVTEINKGMKAKPIKFIQLNLTDVSPPDIVIKSQEAAEERRIAIQTEESKKQIALIQASRDLELAEKDRAVRLLKAETTKQENHIISESVTEQWKVVRYLEVMESMSKNPSAVFVPYEAMTNPGLAVRMFGTDNAPPTKK